MRTLSSSRPERDPANRFILGIDSSTQGVAWTVIDLGRPIASGKIDTTKIKEMNEIMKTIVEVFPQILEEYTPDHIFIEMPIFVANPATARKLTFVVGCLLTIAVQKGYKTTLVEPATHKAFCGYKNITQKFKASAESKLGKTGAKKFCDRLRKSQVQRMLTHNFPEFDASDHDISDSCAIALYGCDRISVPVVLEINKEICFDTDELRRLGLEP